ncbi:hypothetical protein TWF730_005821 [Orbilia blumenaviensis]|uniref:Nonsense-mediated mRNA decay factor n=1 Tax=Orbilia blumenaviensis TaxID=1796055 RepID=A0AAV9VLU1_9PEZI
MAASNRKDAPPVFNQDDHHHNPNSNLTLPGPALPLPDPPPPRVKPQRQPTPHPNVFNPNHPGPSQHGLSQEHTISNSNQPPFNYASTSYPVPPVPPNFLHHISNPNPGNIPQNRRFTGYPGRENQGNRVWEDSQATAASEAYSSATLGQPDVASQADSGDTAVNQIQNFPILLPVNHPLFDPFVHDTVLWPRPDVLEGWEDERIQQEIQETLGDRLREYPGRPRPVDVPRNFPYGPPPERVQRTQAGHPLISIEQIEAGVIPGHRFGPDPRNTQQQHPLAQIPFPANQQFQQGGFRTGHSQPQLACVGHDQRLFQRSTTLPVIGNPLRQNWNEQGQENRPTTAELFQQGFFRGLTGEILPPPSRDPRLPLPQLGSPIHFENGIIGEPFAGSDFDRSNRAPQSSASQFDRNTLWTDEATSELTRYVDFELQMRVAEWEAMRNKASVYEQEITRLLELRDAGDGALERELDERTMGLRNAVEDMLFQNIEFCQNYEVPEKCWMIHHRIIIRYSKAIAALKKDPMRPIELRKMYTYFTKFIKLSSKFYRALVQRLILHFGLQGLKFVAVEFRFELDTSDQERAYPSQIKNFATLVVYESLLHLGDLSRYRENYGEPNPRNPDAKNWGPSKGYYTLARKVIPAHPKAFNQLAVLAQYEHSHFTAIYYLYRSLLAEEPDEATHETTLGNLRICFTKILKDHSSLDGATSDEITTMFSRYHAHCFLSIDASEYYESLKSDLLNQITLAVKERAVPTVILNRMILINIAAEHLALSRDRATLSSPKVVTFLRFNIETFTSLLMVLQQELDGTSQDSREDVAELVSAVTRRMLPSLRLYSAWLLISHHILVNETNDMSLNVQVKQLWQTYATTLSLLQSTFPMRTLSQSPYLLEEDDDIAGFKPLMDTSESRRLGKEVAGVQGRDHPNQESLTRILYLLEDGIELCTAGNVPIDVKKNTFAFQDGIISTDSNTGNTEYPTITLRDIPVNGGIRATSTASRLGQANPMGSVISEPASTTLTNKMNAMVDDLVGSSHSREDSDDDEEVILFKGRRQFASPVQASSKASLSIPAVNNATITAKSPMVAQAFSQPVGTGFASLGGTIGPSSGKGKAPIPSNYMAPHTETVPEGASRASKPAAPLLTASDLVNYVQNYASRMTISQPSQSNMATGQAGPSNMPISQSGPTDAATPKLSSASLERPSQAQAPPLGANPPYYESHPAPNFSGLGATYVQHPTRQPTGPQSDAGANFRSQMSRQQHPMARENARMPPRQGPYNNNNNNNNNFYRQ